MSDKSILRGCTNKDLKQEVIKAMKNGWTIGYNQGQNHAFITKGGEKLTIGLTSSDRNACHRLRRELRAAEKRIKAAK